MGLIYAGSAMSLFWYAPQWLSYYNLLIGGLPGATALGMEPTYYWDGLDRSVLDWLQAHSGPAEKVEFATGAWENLELMRAWGTLRCECRWEAPGEYRWYVMQRRPSAWQPADRWLIGHARPAFTKTIRPHGFGPWRLDVPLVEVYSYQQYLEAVDAARYTAHGSIGAGRVKRCPTSKVQEGRSGISRNDGPELPAECGRFGDRPFSRTAPRKSVDTRRSSRRRRGRRA